MAFFFTASFLFELETAVKTGVDPFRGRARRSSWPRPISVAFDWGDGLPAFTPKALRWRKNNLGIDQLKILRIRRLRIILRAKIFVLLILVDDQMPWSGLKRAGAENFW